MRRSIGVIAAALLAACAGGEEAAPAATAEPVRIDGSVGVLPMMEALAAEYRAAHPDAPLELGPGMGSGERIGALAEGRIDVALASHGLVPAELEAQGLEVHEIARVAVVFGVNADVPVQDLTEAQACDVFAGRVASWSGLGGPDLPIAPRARPRDEVDDEVMTEHLECWGNLALAPSVRVIEDPSELAADLAATPGALGVTTMTLVEQSGGRVRALSLDGVAPTAENVASGAYAPVREFFLVTHREPPAGVAALLEWIRGPEGERVVRANGAVPSS